MQNPIKLSASIVRPDLSTEGYTTTFASDTDLDKLILWGREEKLQFNVKKGKHSSLGRNQDKKNSRLEWGSEALYAWGVW